MKTTFRLFLVLLLATTSIALTAQEKRVSLGIKGGIGFSNMNNGDRKKGKAQIAYQFAATLDYAFTDELYLFSGIEFVTKGAKSKEAMYGLEESTTIKGNYLQLPVYFGYKMILGNPDIRLVCGFGPYLSYGIGGKTKSKVKSAEETVVNIDTFEDGWLKPFDFGLGARIGAEFGQLSLTIDSNLGLLNILDQPDGKVKNSAMYLAVGYRF